MLLALKLALFCLQQPLLRALRPRTLRLLRLQLLHALLQPIDAVLALHARARVALPLLPGLLQLLDALLALADPLLLRWALSQGGRCARARGCGDSRRGRAWRCSDVRHRTRCHGRALRRRSWTEGRCGGPRHGRRRRRASHGRRWRRTSHGGRRRRTGHGRGGRWSGRWCSWRGPSWMLGVRAGARRDHRDHGDAQKKSCKANARPKHDRGSLVAPRSPTSFHPWAQNL